MIRNRRGVTMTETILLLPFVLFVVFFILQIVQLGMCVIVVN